MEKLEDSAKRESKKIIKKSSDTNVTGFDALLKRKGFKGNN